MSVQRLEAELKLAKASERLEAARESMHADRNEETIRAYKKECDTVASIRQEFRSKYQAQVGPGDAAPQVGTIAVKTETRLA